MSKLVYSGKNSGGTGGYGGRGDDYHEFFGGGGSHQVGFQGHGHSTKWKKTIYGYICVCTNVADETYDMFPITSQTMIKAFEQLKGFDTEWADFSPDDDYELPKDWKQAFYVYVNAADIPTAITKNRSVACCAFEATNKYMQHWLGMMLDEDDREWYKLNSLVTSDGLPQKDSFSVIQQLVEPYGLGISSIIVPPNSRRFSEYAPFLMSLGCNPFFLADGYTTNEKALEMMFPDEGLRNTVGRELAKSWRFECREEPMKGCITMVQFQETKTGHNGGSTYRGPRSKGATTNAQGQRSWHMCVKVDKLDGIKYNTPMALEDYKEYPGSSSFVFEAMKDDDGVVLGKRIADLRAEDNKRWQQSNTNSHVGTPLPLPVHQSYAPAVPKPVIEVKESEPIIMKCGSIYKDLGEITNDEFVEFTWDYAEEETAIAVAEWKKRKSQALSGTAPRPDLFAEVKKTDRKVNLTYPPVCEECQKDPGNTYYEHHNSGKTKNCQWCGTLQVKNFDEEANGLKSTPILRAGNTTGQW